MFTRRSLLTVVGALLGPATGPALFELRSYAMQPGRRDELIAMFESVFLDAYERGGTRVLGTFRTPDDPDRWIWLRAFPDAAARGVALERFYGSAEWLARRDVANATIVDSSDVLLLSDASAGVLPLASVPALPFDGVESATTLDATGDRAPGTDAAPLIECAVHPVAPHDERTYARHWLRDAVPRLRTLGAAPFAVLATDRRPNTYPRQAVRGDSVVVTFTRFASPAEHAASLELRARDDAWRREIEPAFAARRRGAIDLRRLVPTARSALR